MGRSCQWIRSGCIAILAAAVVGCGPEDSEEAAASAVSGNQAPVLSGSPPATVFAGTRYAFTPTATDAESDALIFGVDAMPGWLQIDAATGALTGTPGSGDVGTYRGVSIWVSDGTTTSLLPAFDLTVVPASRANNRRPSISGTLTETATTNEFYDFVPVASDADGDALQFAIANLPPWATFDTATGRLSGLPDANDIGIYQNVIINVTDGLLSAALPPSVIVVNPPPIANTPPTIGGTPATTVLEGNAYSFAPIASDADGDTLSFVVVNLPEWATLDSVTGVLSGTPGRDDVGEYDSIRIIVRDGTASTALAAFSITVESLNSSPVISGVPATTVMSGTLYSFTPSATDSDGDALAFRVVNRPPWASFDANTGRLRGTPVDADAGTYAGITISVDDGMDSDALTAFTITVSAANENTPPTISGTPATSLVQDTPYAFQPTATDADGDGLTFSITNRPSWATFNTTSGRLEGTPTAGDVGTYAGIIISVSDGTESVALGTFGISVVPAANGSATLSWTPPTQNSDGSPLTDLSGYTVHWGTSPGAYTQSERIDNPGVSTFVIGNLLSGMTYYFAVKARNERGIASDFSNEASKAIP